MKKLLISAVMVFALNAQAQTSVCSSGDISGATFLNCAGYVDGNLISNSPSGLSGMATLFQQLGISNPNTQWMEKLNSISGNTIDFNNTLSGRVLVAVHHGGGSPGQSTALYLLDAGTSVDKLQYNLNGLSNAALYQIPVSPIPEPGTWALMIAGLATVLFTAKRRLK